jgi:hypothetical protein
MRPSNNVMGLLLPILMLTTNEVFSMEFRIFRQPELNQKVVIAEGEISDGDVERFVRMSRLADRDKYGNITLVLNSLGGSVSAAFELVKIMDDLETTALVPQNALCASACASIVYVSAEHHMILGDGKLGFHTCYSNGGGSYVPNSFCNELIAQNAVLRGTSYAAVDMFTHDFGPGKMAWLDGKLACELGLCRPYTTEWDPLAIPSFPCDRPKNAYQRLVCSDKRLAKYDAKISRVLTQMKKTKAGASSLGADAEQTLYLRRLETCPEKDMENCLRAEMKKRLADLYRIRHDMPPPQ